MPGPDTGRDLLVRATTGDEAAFAALIQPHERSVFRHCYRMLGSGTDAEDAVQETLVRVWRRLASFDGSGAFTGWLHTIATNVCLDMLRSRHRRLDPVEHGPPSAPGRFSLAPDPDLWWVEPVGDAALAGPADPQDEVVRREEVSLAFVAALQLLAPRQRAALLLHDVLGFNHSEVSEVLGITPSAVNSLLSRARQTVRARPRVTSPDPADGRVAELLDRYVRAWQLADINAFVELVAEDVRFSMPPLSAWFDGRAAVTAFTEAAIFSAVRPHGVTMRAGRCNGQPAFATYGPDADGQLVANGLQVLEIADRSGRLAITAIVSFRDPRLVDRCGLPLAIAPITGDLYLCHFPGK